ncbi:MAG: hypothetical protein OXE93_06510 [bacterium]|nr:hypothetical protein [bacterium]
MHWQEHLVQQSPVPSPEVPSQVPVGLPEGLDCVDQNVLGDLYRGAIDKLPEGALECLPSDIRNRIPDELIDFASTNPYLSLGAVAVAVLFTGLCLYKLARRAVIVALLLGAVAGVAWWWGLGGGG